MADFGLFLSSMFVTPERSAIPGSAPRSGQSRIGQLASFYCARCRHNGVMEDRKPKRRSMWLLIEFWFALLLTIGMMVYGVGSMIGALVDGS